MQVSVNLLHVFRLQVVCFSYQVEFTSIHVQSEEYSKEVRVTRKKSVFVHSSVVSSFHCK